MALNSSTSRNDGSENGHDGAGDVSRSGLLKLALGSLGVVFGDIGTSPLYAFREAIAAATGRGRLPRPRRRPRRPLADPVDADAHRLDQIRADPAARRQPRRGRHAVADGARAARAVQARRAGSCCSASSARRSSTATPRSRRRSRCSRRSRASPSRRRASTTSSLPLTIVILIGALRRAAHRHRPRLHLLRSDHGALVRRARGVGACRRSRASRRVLLAINPYYAVSFLFTHKFIAFVTLGAVFLVVTGAEALYADLGHFGRQPDPGGMVLRGLPGAGAQLSRPGRAGPERPGGAREPVLPALPGLGAHPGRHPRDGGDGDRQPGGHQRHLFADPPGDPARPAAAHAHPLHVGDDDRPDLHAAHQLAAVHRGRAADAALRIVGEPRRRPTASRSPRRWWSTRRSASSCCAAAGTGASRRRSRRSARSCSSPHSSWPRTA